MKILYLLAKRFIAGHNFDSAKPEINRLIPHQIEALEETDIIESSTFHKDEDSYRVWRGTPTISST